MIDNEMSCSPNPQWLKDFKQEIQKEFSLSSLDATCIAGKVARIVRNQDKKACEWLKEHVAVAYIDMGKGGFSECHCPDWWLDDFRKAIEE